MRACGFSAERRLERVLAELLASGGATEQALEEAWKSYAALGEYHRVTYGPKKFFALGIWRDDRLWALDEARMARAREQRVGMR